MQMYIGKVIHNYYIQPLKGIYRLELARAMSLVGVFSVAI